jgi:hypothetical protein
MLLTLPVLLCLATYLYKIQLSLLTNQGHTALKKCAVNHTKEQKGGSEFRGKHPDKKRLRFLEAVVKASGIIA